MSTNHKIIFGDSRCMREIQDKGVQLIITSPPYWQLKDYGVENQIGFDDTYEEYINNLNLVWKECYRALDNGCRLCVNIGDQFARSVYYGRYKVIPIRTEIIKFCETIGFDYMGAIIWQKVTTCNTTGGATIMGSFPYPRNGIIKIDYEFILIFKKTGKPTKKVAPEIKKQSRLTKKEWNEYFYGHWNFAGVKQDKHLAMFPEELPRRLIKMFSFVGDTILDPFLGSGTTSLAAKNLQRNSIGYEINHSFEPIIRQRLGIAEKQFIRDAEHIFVTQENPDIDFEHQIAHLPYIFKDPVQFDKKVDPRKLQFGSRIDNSKAQRKKLYSIRKILSPEKMLLESDVTIRLLGIKENPQKTQEAIDFLEKITRGQKVFLKFDSQKHDRENNLLCYVYLKNKTFVNAHLIKKGLVDIDKNSDYKKKARFRKLQQG